MKLLIALAQTCGEDMVLPTIQLLRVALVTRLLLLLLTPLMIITTLVALIALIAMSALIAMKTRTGTASTVTRPMRSEA